MTVSFAGLDLSFMKNDPPIRSAKPKKRAPDRRSTVVQAPYFMNDIKEFVANATDKPVRITSRTQLAAYERSNNVKQCGDFKPGAIVAKEKKRIQDGLDRAKALSKKAKATASWA
jgi:hypothetical protein